MQTRTYRSADLEVDGKVFTVILLMEISYEHFKIKINKLLIISNMY